MKWCGPAGSRGQRGQCDVRGAFSDRDERGQPIVSQVMEVYIPDMPEGGSTLTIAADNTFTSTLTYPPLSVDAATERVSLTVRERYDDPRVPLSSSLVTFVDDKTVRIDMKPAIAMGFDQGAIYELVYTAKNPYVGGMGFAMVRDLISYLRNQTADSAGNENPARPGGMALKAAIGWGHSQSGRFLKDMIYQGFNQDVSGKMVFDGVIELVTGSRMTDHNTAFAQSSRWLRQHEDATIPLPTSRSRTRRSMTRSPGRPTGSSPSARRHRPVRRSSRTTRTSRPGTGACRSWSPTRPAIRSPIFPRT